MYHCHAPTHHVTFETLHSDWRRTVYRVRGGDYQRATLRYRFYAASVRVRNIQGVAMEWCQHFFQMYVRKKRQVRSVGLR